jgi:adenine-specific DNA-methyltransferase
MAKKGEAAASGIGASRPKRDAKDLGAVYTPAWLVDRMLGWADIPEDPTGLSFADIACGDGAFLGPLVERLCAGGRARRLTDEDLRAELRRAILGTDVSAAAIADCRARLDRIAAAHGLAGVDWDLRVQDALDPDFLSEQEGTRDWVVGNPPYVRVQNLAPEQRALVRALSVCAQGSTDLYVAFFDLAHRIVRPGGGVAFVAPSSWLTSRTGKELRAELADGRLTKIVSFGDHQVFEGATAYVAVAVLRKGRIGSSFRLLEWTGSDAQELGDVPCCELLADVPVLLSETDRRRLAMLRRRGTPLGKLARISVGFLTLADDVYVMARLSDDPATGLSRLRRRDGLEVEIETALLRRAVKASTWKGEDHDQRLAVLFPYSRETGRSVILDEERLAREFPRGYAYLLANRARLDARDRGKSNPVAWYAFGRSQGLDTAFGVQLLTAPIAKAPRFLLQSDPEACFFSGYSVVPHACAPRDLQAVLVGEDLRFWIQRTSKSFRGGYKAVTKTYLKGFGVVLPPESLAVRRAA